MDKAIRVMQVVAVVVSLTLLAVVGVYAVRWGPLEPLADLARALLDPSLHH